MINRKHTKEIKIGNVMIGGDNPIAIQSMTNTDTADAAATAAQIQLLERAGCDIIRCAVPGFEAAEAIGTIRRNIHIPLVADIHFDHKLAIAAVEAGADKIRINPGNIGGPDKILEVVKACKERSVPIRVGVNSGSLEKEILRKYNGVSAEGLVESAMHKVRLIEDAGYDNIVVSIKSSDVMMCADSYRLFSQKSDYPLHIGITEAGTVTSGNIKSAVGLTLILSSGIGDTVRVSLTGDPVEEVRSAKLILSSLGLSRPQAELISCPTCGRTKIDLIPLAEEVEKLLINYSDLSIKVAVMGCAVNGPGEAKEADIGIAGGDGEGLIFKHGRIIKKVPEGRLLDELKLELDKL